MTQMTHAEISALVNTAASAAANQTMLDILSMLRVDRADMESMTAFGDDLRYLRRQRLAAEKISFKAIVAFLGTAATGATAIMWLGLQDFLHR